MAEKKILEKKILLTNRYTGAPLRIVQEQTPEGFGILFPGESTPEALESAVPEADYILAGGRLRITRELLDRAGRLKMIQRSGVGLDALDLDAIRENGIPLYVNRGVNAQSVAEHALLLMLACLRRLTEIDRNTKAGVWKKQEQGVRTAELSGKTVGLIGMGHIGRTLAGLLRPFGTEILYTDLRREDPGFEREHRMRYTGLGELLEKSDVVSVHCALTGETRNLINADSIARMKDGAVLVNTARGEIADPAAVAAALASGKLSFAGLDVHGQEPIPEDYPLKQAENVILTPHIAGVTGDSFRAMMAAAFRNIACFDRGETEAIGQYRYL